MAAPRKNYDEAVKKYQAGISVPAIAACYGMANQCMYKILKRRGCKIRHPQKDHNAVCSVVGCGCPVKATGLCARHSWQAYRHGKIISVASMRDRDRICVVDGCGRKHRGNGYCNGHLLQYRKYGAIVSEILAPRVGVMACGDYVWLKVPDHPYNKDGYVKRANLVWEAMTGQVVVPPALIHHKNGRKKDDSFDNLEYHTSDLEHQKAHHVRMGIRGFIPGGIF